MMKQLSRLYATITSIYQTHVKFSLIIVVVAVVVVAVVSMTKLLFASKFYSSSMEIVSKSVAVIIIN